MYEIYNRFKMIILVNKFNIRKFYYIYRYIIFPNATEKLITVYISESTS